MKTINEKQGAGFPAPKGDTTSTRRSDKRKAEMQTAAELNGFETWSGMMTYIKNQALQNRKVVDIKCLHYRIDPNACVCLDCGESRPVVNKNAR